MPDVPPPASSPKPPRAPDGDTQPGVASTEYVKLKLGPLVSQLRALAVAVGAVATGVVAVVLFVDNRVAAQTDAGVKVHEARITTLEQQRKEDKDELDQRLKRIEGNANADHELALGTSQKVDKLLERFNVPNPSPAPKDGGP